MLTENETSLIATRRTRAPNASTRSATRVRPARREADGVEFQRLKRAHAALAEILARLDTKALAIEIPPSRRPPSPVASRVGIFATC